MVDPDGFGSFSAGLDCLRSGETAPVVPGTAKLPYVTQLGNYPMTKAMLFRDFPDLFAPEFREAARQYAQGLAAYKGMYDVMTGAEPASSQRAKEVPKIK